MFCVSSMNDIISHTLDEVSVRLRLSSRYSFYANLLPLSSRKECVFQHGTAFCAVDSKAHNRADHHNRIAAL
jgi:hypothetical protein